MLNSCINLTSKPHSVQDIVPVHGTDVLRSYVKVNAFLLFTMMTKTNLLQVTSISLVGSGIGVIDVGGNRNTRRKPTRGLAGDRNIHYLQIRRKSNTNQNKFTDS